MKYKKNKKLFNGGFTLIELLIVIAIIGILAGVVLVSTTSSVDKAKKSAAVSSMSSMLPELVTCQDDSGEAKSDAAPTGGATFICCTDNTCSVAVTGHDTAKWPDIAKTGYLYIKPTGSIQSTGNYTYTAKNAKDDVITCKYADNSCSQF